MKDTGATLKLVLFVLLALFFFRNSDSQVPIKLRSTHAMGGSSLSFVSGNRHFYIQQSIGQSGVIGPAGKEHYLLRQGFLQPLLGSTFSIQSESLSLTIYPNPFASQIILRFDEEIQDPVCISMLDMKGKTVYFQNHHILGELKLDLGHLEPSVYIILLTTKNKSYYSKLVKY